MIGAVVYGFMNGGSPWTARNQKLDSTRLSALKEIKYAIEAYYNRNKTLPQNLAETKEFLYGQKGTSDPETGSEYEYKTTGTLSYQLCANFSENQPENDPYGYNISSVDPLSKYQKGHFCFDLQVVDYSNNNNSSFQTTNQIDNLKQSEMVSAKISEDTVTVSRTNSYAEKSNIFNTPPTYLTDVVCPDNYQVAEGKCEGGANNDKLSEFSTNSHGPTQEGFYCSYRSDKNFQSNIQATCKKNYFSVYKTPDEIYAEVNPLTYSRFELWTSIHTTVSEDNKFETASLQCPTGYKAVAVVGCSIDASITPPPVKFVSAETSGQKSSCKFEASQGFKVIIRTICDKA